MDSPNLPLLTGNLESIKQKLYQNFPINQRGVVSDIRKRILINKHTKANTVSRLTAPLRENSENISESFSVKVA